jgi:hypothetical protein
LSCRGAAEDDGGGEVGEVAFVAGAGAVGAGGACASGPWCCHCSRAARSRRMIVLLTGVGCGAPVCCWRGELRNGK